MAEETQVISCHNVDHWKTHFNAGQTSNKLIVVDFTATWCPPCRMMAPLFADLSKKFCNVVFLKVDVDELKDVAEEMGVEAMPTFLFFFAGKVVDKVVGAMKKEVLASKIEALLASIAAANNTATQTATT